jgi:hypothetical protein
LYCSLNTGNVIKSRRLRLVEHAARMGESRNPFKIVISKPIGKSPLGKPRHR